MGIVRRILALGGWGQRAEGNLPETTAREERANSLTGAVGLVASLLGCAFLLHVVVRHGAPVARISAGVYGVTLVLAYAATTLYHAARRGPLKERLRLLDHCAVFALIAGTYTPVALAGLGGRLGWSLAATVWTLAALGILFKLRYRFRFPGATVLCYLLLGWLAVLILRPLLDAVGPRALLLLVAGGLSYTLGTVFYGAKRLPHNHAVWHLLVMVGSACHYAAILAYVLVPGG